MRNFVIRSPLPSSFRIALASWRNQLEGVERTAWILDGKTKAKRRCARTRTPHPSQPPPTCTLHTHTHSWNFWTVFVCPVCCYASLLFGSFFYRREKRMNVYYHPPSPHTHTHTRLVHIPSMKNYYVSSLFFNIIALLYTYVYHLHVSWVSADGPLQTFWPNKISYPERRKRV
jgi:hypothetical protein